MAQAPYKGFSKKEAKDLLTKSKIVTSFGGPNYEREHKKTVAILMEQQRMQRTPEMLRKNHEEIIGSSQRVLARKLEKNKILGL